MIGLQSYFLSAYSMEEEYVLARKAQFLFWIVALYLPLMALLPFAMLATGGKALFIKTIPMCVPQIIASLISLLYLKKRKVRTCANILSVATFSVAALGYFTRPVPLNGVTLGYFLFASMVFTVFFCSYYLSIVVFLISILTMISYYIFFSIPQMKTAPEIVRQAGSAMMVDGVIFFS